MAIDLPMQYKNYNQLDCGKLGTVNHTLYFLINHFPNYYELSLNSYIKNSETENCQHLRLSIPMYYCLNCGRKLSRDKGND